MEDFVPIIPEKVTEKHTIMVSKPMKQMIVDAKQKYHLDVSTAIRNIISRHLPEIIEAAKKKQGI